MSNFGSYSEAKNVIRFVFRDLITQECKHYNAGAKNADSCETHNLACQNLLEVEKLCLAALDSAEAHEIRMFEEHYNQHNNPLEGVSEDFEEVH